jgi:hypothetical protein
MDWFERLTGIDEQTSEQVRQQISVDGEFLLCPNGNRLAFGRLETPSLAELRRRVNDVEPSGGGLRVREVVGDVRQLHADQTNAGALFQVASQFNLLEMTGPSVTPEQGVGIYENDLTQGPACAIACGAGTIYRNYFAPVGKQIGQSAAHQIDCSSDLGSLLENENGKLWTMNNGYLFPTDEGLDRITATLRSTNEDELDRYRASLRIGLQWNTAVTLPDAKHQVSQAYCSALPVAYGRQPMEAWSDFAQLILEAAYESTICAAIINYSNKVFLTLLGGGVFGNQDDWIMNAMQRAMCKYSDHQLDVAIVSYGSSKDYVAKMVARWDC